MAGRIIGLDFGSKTVGVAVSDPLRVTAQGVEIIRRTSEGKLRKTYARIEELVREYGAERIIVGLPKHMNNDEGVRAEKSRAFAENLARRTGLPVELYDERLTTVAADRAMNEMRIRGADRKKFVDEIAAVLILQGYLDGLAMKKNS
jgi:putative Holliday junction resolvase